jgi:hypothetical protein
MGRRPGASPQRRFDRRLLRRRFVAAVEGAMAAGLACATLAAGARG